MPTIVFAGGGTGGHVFPALAIAERLRESATDVQCVWLCSERAIDAQILGEAKVEFTPIAAQPFGVRPRALARFCRAWGPSVRTARRVMRELKASDAGGSIVCAAMGGFVAAPAVQAARAERLCSVLVNLDAVPGKANRWIARRAQVRLSAIQGQQVPAQWEQVGPIVRTQARAPGDAAGCRKALGLSCDTRTLFVSGGSQGAVSINRFMMGLCESHPEALEGWQVVHQCGSGATGDLERAYTCAGVRAVVREFILDIGVAWGSADLALCRCGAGSVGEALVNGVQRVFLPYPHHRDEHQRLNAQPLVDAGAAVMLTDHVSPGANIAAHGVELAALLQSGDRLAGMRKAIGSLELRDGARDAAERLLEIAHQ